MMINPGNGRGALLFGRLALLLPRMLAGLVSAVEAVEVVATLLEESGAETLQAVVLKP